MAMIEQSALPFQVQVWVKSTDAPSILGIASWLEMARCVTEQRAREVAECLHIRHKLVRVSELELQGDRFVPFLWFPDQATVEHETRE